MCGDVCVVVVVMMMMMMLGECCGNDVCVLWLWWCEFAVVVVVMGTW